MSQIPAVKSFTDADESVERDGLVGTRIVDEFGALGDRDELESVAPRGEEDVHAANDLADHGLVEGFDVDEAFFAQPEGGEDVRLVHGAAAFVDTLFVVEVFVGEGEHGEHLRATLSERKEDDVDGRLLKLALLLKEVFVDRGLLGVQRLFFDHFATAGDYIFVAEE